MDSLVIAAVLFRSLVISSGDADDCVHRSSDNDVSGVNSPGAGLLLLFHTMVYQYLWQIVCPLSLYLIIHSIGIIRAFSV